MITSIKIVNALTIDIEDYFHIHAFSNVICPEDWCTFEPRVERNTYRLLDLLDSCNGPPQWNGLRIPRDRWTTEDGRGSKPRATFFLLGWVAVRFPELVREIHARGHEVACHGFAHQCIYNQTEGEFKEDVRRAKEILENLVGTQVIGYRAPTCSITHDTLWALEILCELGFQYDSSIFPVRHDFYGFPEAPRFPFYIDFSDGDLLSQFQNPKFLHEIEDTVVPRNQKTKKPNRSAPCALSPRPELFIEFPLSTINVFGHNLPCSGGGYFRLFPYWYTRMGLKRLNSNDSRPAVFYIHPWELDPDIPVVKRASWLSKFRTYVNLSKTESRFKRLLQEFHFAPLASILNAYS